MEWYESNVSKPDYICLLEPTVPLRKVNTLLESFEYIYGNSNIKSLFSVTKSADSPVYIKENTEYLSHTMMRLNSSLTKRTTDGLKPKNSKGLIE